MLTNIPLYTGYFFLSRAIVWRSTKTEHVWSLIFKSNIIIEVLQTKLSRNAIFRNLNEAFIIAEDFSSWQFLISPKGFKDWKLRIDLEKCLLARTFRSELRVLQFQTNFWIHACMWRQQWETRVLLMAKLVSKFRRWHFRLIPF